MENASKAMLIAATVLIVIILVAFGMKVLTSPKDSIDEAQDVKDSISDASQIALDKLDASLNKGGATEPTQETISTETSYIGCYADIDGNGSVDGIIYADLAVGGEKTDLNTYYIRQEKHTDIYFGEREVIVPKDRVESNDRFYVMALEDFNGGTEYCWYAGAYGNLSDRITESDFGSGKQNTSKMIEAWKNEEYGSKNTGSYKDVWGEIGTQVDRGWFVPSSSEWIAIVDGLEIEKVGYRNLGLKISYWTSCVSTTKNAAKRLFSWRNKLYGVRC